MHQRDNFWHVNFFQRWVVPNKIQNKTCNVFKMHISLELFCKLTISLRHFNQLLDLFPLPFIVTQ